MELGWLLPIFDSGYLIMVFILLILDILRYILEYTDIYGLKFSKTFEQIGWHFWVAKKDSKNGGFGARRRRDEFITGGLWG